METLRGKLVLRRLEAMVRVVVVMEWGQGKLAPVQTAALMAAKVVIVQLV